MKKNEIDSKGYIATLLEPGIVENIVSEYTSIDTEDVLQMKKLNLELTGGKPYAVLVNAKMFSTITKEARELSASKEFVQNTRAKALLTYSTGQRIFANFYLKINKPKIRTKIFSDRDKAIIWLRKQLQS